MSRRPRERVVLALAARVWSFRLRVVAALVFLIVAKLAAVMVPVLLKRIVDTLGRPETLASLPVLLLAGYAVVRFSTTLFGELRDLVFVRASQSTVAEFTQRVFRHLHALGARFHANRATGALTRDVERGTAAIGFLLGVALFTIVPTLVEIAAVVGIMVAGYDDRFALIIAATFVVYAIFTVVFTRRRAIRQRRVNELDTNANRRLVDSMLNYDTVKFYNNENFEAQRFREIMNEWIEAGVGNQRALTLLHIGQSGIIAVGIAAVMLLAGQEVWTGVMTVGDLVLVNAYVIQVCLPLNSLGFVFREATDAMVKAERLFALLREETDAAAALSLPPLTVTDGEVVFEHVDFGYVPDRQVLWDVNFRIPPGSTVAVVGGSGSGKSTLARLLLRFYDTWRGRILIDGQDISRFSAGSARAAVGIVPQDTTLFNETIAWNIGYGRIGATREEIVEAARAANVHDFITALPEQYEMVVGERGLKLSGGEKQRIAIARAILKNPPILVLDEATSALDMRAERAIQGALQRLAHRRTTLTIAHRLATIADADEILVLEHGRIVERGRHADLLRQAGLYAQMWSLQEQENALRRSERRASMQPINLANIIAGAVDAVRTEIDEKQIILYTTLGIDVGLVTGDPGDLHDVVRALLSRAVQASDPGARVEVVLTRAGNEILLRVSDTGSRAAALPVQPDMLNAIVEEHQGRLAVEPQEPAGATYTLALPVRAVSVETALPRTTPSEEISLAGRRLILVDDNEDARETLGVVLKLHGAEVESFEGGQSALEYLRSRRLEEWPDLMICDIGLPDEDGYTLLRRIRSLEAEQRLPLGERMPAIALTGYARGEDRVQALLAGFQAHLAKPAAVDELLSTVARLL